MAERRLLILGAGAHARAVADVALACGWSGAGFVAAAGALGGLATFGATIVVSARRSRRPHDRAETAVPLPAGPPASLRDMDGWSA